MKDIKIITAIIVIAAITVGAVMSSQQANAAACNNFYDLQEGILTRKCSSPDSIENANNFNDNFHVHGQYSP